MTSTLRSIFRGFVPRELRLQLSRAISERGAARLAADLRAMAQSGRPVIIGPWLGEVGFELLYWVPFLAWACREAGFTAEQLHVVSRGGTGEWYRELTPQYSDVFDFIEPDEFRRRNRARLEQLGEQKQIVATDLERDLVARLSARDGLVDPVLLHPSVMYRLYAPYWWTHQSMEWMERHAVFERLPVPTPAVGLNLPVEYTAVKFYFNDSFPATADNRAFATAVVKQLAEAGPVVSLATGLLVDDHFGWEEEERHAERSIRAGLMPARNLALQSAIVAGARAWVGTYGGFAYLAPFHGVPARAFYSNPDGFSRRHLDLALHVFERFGTGLLEVSGISPRAVQECA